jgi:pullulanase/glycogen debranching enzyme
VLFSSLGIPMISAGQDFLRSKHGINNTYLRGDINALDYKRIYRYSGTHAYFAAWIAFRRCERGTLMRQWSRPSEGFFRSFTLPGSHAMALLYNADLSQGLDQLLFAINATGLDVEIPLEESVTSRRWQQVADHERFIDLGTGALGVLQPMLSPLFVPALGCALWHSDGSTQKPRA